MTCNQNSILPGGLRREMPEDYDLCPSPFSQGAILYDTYCMMLCIRPDAGGVYGVVNNLWENFARLPGSSRGRKLFTLRRRIEGWDGGSDSPSLSRMWSAGVPFCAEAGLGQEVGVLLSDGTGLVPVLLWGFSTVKIGGIYSGLKIESPFAQYTFLG